MVQRLHKQNDHQQSKRKEVERKGQRLEDAVIHPRCDKHDKDAERRGGKLPGDIEKRVALEVEGVGVARREHHDQPERNEHQDDDEKGRVHRSVDRTGRVLCGTLRSHDWCSLLSGSDGSGCVRPENGGSEAAGGEKCQQRADDGDEREGKADLHLGVTGHLKVVMNRAHFKNPSAGRLEADHLNHHRQGFADINQADQSEQQRRADSEGHRHDTAAEKHRAGVAHENLGGVKVVDQKADAASGHRHGQKLGLEILQQHRHGEKTEGGHRRHRSRESVESVGQVDRVHDIDDSHRAEGVVKPGRKGKLAEEGDEQHRRGVSGGDQAPEIEDGDEKLDDELLLGSQAEVLLFGDLNIVVGKADEREAGRHQQPRNQPGVENPVVALGQLGVREQRRRKGGGNRTKNPRDKHQPAHGGGALLVFVPGRADLKNRLAVFEPAQKRDQPEPEQGGHTEGDGRRQVKISVHSDSPFR